MRVASLHVYPVKGAGGIGLDSATLLASGIRHDRRFMVLGADGAFVTQRSHPRMALVAVAIDEASDRLTLSTPDLGAVTVPLTPEGPSRRARVWSDEVDAIDVGGDGARFFSDYLGEPCSLVFMPKDSVRPVEAPHGRADDRVGFADAYPVLVASLGSLADLNARLRAKGAPPVPMNRFRPSIVIGPEDIEPYAEDRASTIRIGDVSLRTPKGCARCVVTTVDQSTATTSKEPLKTLASYRRVGSDVLFAMNAIPDLDPGRAAAVNVGDDVTFG